MRYVLMFDTPLWILLCVVLFAWVVRLRHRLAESERIIDGLDNPVAFLPEKEQAQWARDRLADEKFERNTETLNQFNRKW